MSKKPTLVFPMNYLIVLYTNAFISCLIYLFTLGLNTTFFLIFIIILAFQLLFQIRELHVYDEKIGMHFPFKCLFIKDSFLPYSEYSCITFKARGNRSVSKLVLSKEGENLFIDRFNSNAFIPSSNQEKILKLIEIAGDKIKFEFQVSNIDIEKKLRKKLIKVQSESTGKKIGN